MSRYDLDALRDRLPLADFAGGLTELRARGGEHWGPCPLHEEATASFHVRADGRRWHCFGCGKGGDVLDLAAEAWGLSLRETIQRLAAQVGLDGASPAHPRPQPDRHQTAPRPPRPPAPDYPPADQVAALWRAAPRVLDAPPVAAWLASRGADPAAVEDLDLARALPLDAVLPRWAGTWGARGGRSWAASGHWCLLPVYDPDGVRRSLRARHVGGFAPEGAREPWAKALAPSGCRASGLLLACPLARAALAGAWPTAVDAGHPLGPAGDPRAVARAAGWLLVEGDPDWLAAASRCAEGRGPAVLGLLSGTGRADGGAAAALAGAAVREACHEDAAGRRYVAAFLAGAGR